MERAFVRLAAALLAASALACTPENRDAASAPGTATSGSSVASPAAACPDSASALRAYLDALAKEGVMHGEVVPAPDSRFEDRPLPNVPLVRVAETPRPLPHAALVVLDARSLRFASATASIADASASRAVFTRASDSDLSPGFGSGNGQGSSFTKLFTFFVGERETWRDVTAAVGHAQAVGFTEVAFVFLAESRVSPPPASPRADALRALASDPKEMPWKRDVALQRAFAAATEPCPALAAPFATKADDTTAMQAQRDAFVRDAASAFERCGCNVDASDVETFAWLTFGRHWGPGLTFLVVDLGTRTVGDSAGPTRTPLRAAGDSAFAQVVPTLRAASPDGQYQLTAD